MVRSLTFSSLYLHYSTKNHCPLRHVSSKEDHKRPKRGQWPIPWKSPNFPKIAKIFLPLVSIWNYSAHKNQQPHALGPLSLSEKVHILPMESASLWINSLSLFSWILSCMKPKTLTWWPSQGLMQVPGCDFSFSCNSLSHFSQQQAHSWSWWSQNTKGIPHLPSLSL